MPRRGLSLARPSRLHALRFGSLRIVRLVHAQEGADLPLSGHLCGWIPQLAAQSVRIGEKNERSYTSDPPERHNVVRLTNLNSKGLNSRGVGRRQRRAKQTVPWSSCPTKLPPAPPLVQHVIDLPPSTPF